MKQQRVKRRRQPRHCSALGHAWILLDRVLLTVPTLEGWARALLQRICSRCQEEEDWVVEQHHGLQQARIPPEDGPHERFRITR